MDLQLPTVISSSTILNAVIRGAERAARELGPDYRVLVTGDFSAAVRVYRIIERSSSDVLSPNQPVPKSEAPIWSMKLSKGESRTGMLRSSSRIILCASSSSLELRPRSTSKP